MNYKYDVSIVIVNYNGEKYLAHLFDSLKKIEHKSFTFEVIIVDNNSSDNSISLINQQLKSKIQNLKVLVSKKNLGFGGGNNLGISKSEGKYIVLLNNDTVVDKYWLYELHKMISTDSTVAMVNSKIFFYYEFIKMRFLTKDRINFRNNISINSQPYKIESKFCKNLLNFEDEIVCFDHSEIHIPLIEGITDYNFSFSGLVRSGDADAVIIGDSTFYLHSDSLTISINKEQIEKYSYRLIQNAGSGVTQSYSGYDIGFGQEDHENFNVVYELNNGCGASIIFRKEDFDNCGGFDERFLMYYEDTDLSYRMKKIGKILYCPTSIVYHHHAGSSKEWSPFFIIETTRSRLLFIYKNTTKIIFLKHLFLQIYLSIKERNKYIFKGILSFFRVIR